MSRAKSWCRDGGLHASSHGLMLPGVWDSLAAQCPRIGLSILQAQAQTLDGEPRTHKMQNDAREEKEKSKEKKKTDKKQYPRQVAKAKQKTATTMYTHKQEENRQVKFKT